MKTVIRLCMLISLHSQVYANIEPFINNIAINQQKITYFVNQDFHTSYLRDNLYVIYPNDIKLGDLDYTILTMPLIMNTISLVWISGKNYSIEAMDRDLYYSLEKIRTIFKRFYPITSFNGNLIPNNLVDNSKLWKQIPSAKGIALPFSHGLDSLCSSLRWQDTPQLLITVRGYPDTPLDYWNGNWDYTQKVITKFAQTHHHATCFITSNFHEFFNWAVLYRISPEIDNWRVCMVEGLGWMGLAAPILISKKYATFVLPANNDWLTPHPGADCPLIVENVSFAGVTNISDGFEFNRMEKNKIIADICRKHSFEKPFCMICEKILENRKNCCHCLKCVASIIAFLLINEDPKEYGFTINITDFIDFFKTTFLHTIKLEDYSAGWFIYGQQIARKKLNTFTQELQDFFTWYTTIDFNALAQPSAQTKLDYTNFTDVYANIPKQILNLTINTRRCI